MFQSETLGTFGYFVFGFMLVVFILICIFSCTCKRRIIEDSPSENDQNDGFIAVGTKPDTNED